MPSHGGRLSWGMQAQAAHSGLSWAVRDAVLGCLYFSASQSVPLVLYFSEPFHRKINYIARLCIFCLVGEFCFCVAFVWRGVLGMVVFGYRCYMLRLVEMDTIQPFTFAKLQ